MTPKIVLTGFEESRPVLFQRGGRLSPGPTTHYLIFNEGAFRVPCDESTFSQIVDYWKIIHTDPQLKEDELPYGAEVFSASTEDNPPPPPVDQEEDSSGQQDDAEDGIGQL